MSCAQQLLPGNLSRTRRNRKQHYRSAQQGYCIRMSGIDCFKSHFHGQVKCDTVAVLPLAAYRGKPSGDNRTADALGVYQHRSALRPGWNSKVCGELGRPRQREFKFDQSIIRIGAPLSKRKTCPVDLALQRRWNIQVHKNSLRIAKICTDAVIGCNLRKRARAARPAVF